MAVSSQISHIVREWELSWGDDADETFDSIFMLVAKENLPKQIADMFAVPVPNAERKGGLAGMVRRFLGIKPKRQVKLSAPLVLSWLFYGKSFESMVAMMDKQMSDKNIERSDRLKCSSAVKDIISVSIKSGYRTKEDWERYFAKEKSAKENKIGEWTLQDVMKDIPIKIDSPAEVEAEDMSLRLPLCNGVEYGIALTKQFPDVKELRSDHSIRQAVGKLAGKDTQMLIKDDSYGRQTIYKQFYLLRHGKGRRQDCLLQAIG